MTRYRATFGGRLVAAQRWSIGFSFTDGVEDAAVPDAATMAALAQQLYADFISSAWSTTASPATPLSARIGSEGNLDQCRLYAYATEGATQAGTVGVSSGAAVAGTTSPIMPPQVAIVASLRTDFPGRSNRGRVYIPNRTAVLSTDGQVTASVCTAVATAVANFLSLARTRTVRGGNLVPIVDSSTAPDTEVTRVTVDSILDTQRRRRDKLVAATNASANLVVG